MEIASKNILHTSTDKRRKLYNLYHLQQKTHRLLQVHWHVMSLPAMTSSSSLEFISIQIFRECCFWVHVLISVYELEKSYHWSCSSQWQLDSQDFLSVLLLLHIFTPNHWWHHSDVLMAIDFGIDTLDLKTCTKIRWLYIFKSIMQDKFATSNMSELYFMTLTERLDICYLFKTMYRAS